LLSPGFNPLRELAGILFSQSEGWMEMSIALVKTPDGTPVDQPRDQKIDTHLAGEKLSSIRQNGVGYRGFLDLAPGNTRSVSLSVTTSADASGRWPRL
jgi:hypothetical protein